MSTYTTPGSAATVRASRAPSRTPCGAITPHHASSRRNSSGSSRLAISWSVRSACVTGGMARSAATLAWKASKAVGRNGDPSSAPASRAARVAWSGSAARRLAWVAVLGSRRAAASQPDSVPWCTSRSSAGARCSSAASTASALSPRWMTSWPTSGVPTSRRSWSNRSSAACGTGLRRLSSVSSRGAADRKQVERSDAERQGTPPAAAAQSFDAQQRGGIAGINRRQIRCHHQPRQDQPGRCRGRHDADHRKQPELRQAGKAGEQHAGEPQRRGHHRKAKRRADAPQRAAGGLAAFAMTDQQHRVVDRHAQHGDAEPQRRAMHETEGELHRQCRRGDAQQHRHGDRGHHPERAGSATAAVPRSAGSRRWRAGARRG